MTREEEILKKAIDYSEIEGNLMEYEDDNGYVWDDQDFIKQAFISGAKWADETLIEKACEWIEQYLFDLGYPDDWCRDSPNIESGKERFIKAMKGE